MSKYIFDGHKLVYHIDRVNNFLERGDCFPLYMEISIVGSCNHRCIFCAYDYIGHPNRKLETNALLRFIDQLSQCGVRSILYAGEGEPLLHPDLDKDSIRIAFPSLPVIERIVITSFYCSFFSVAKSFIIRSFKFQLPPYELDLLISNNKLGYIIRISTSAIKYSFCTFSCQC